ncbi:MAG: hypothetical protein IPO37_14870 [Saprospiraceae bacterium]|nr:hypothetical protein [Saprospiraceae bacterium]
MKFQKKYHATDLDWSSFCPYRFLLWIRGLIDIFRKDAAKWFWEKHDQQNKIVWLHGGAP